MSSTQVSKSSSPSQLPIEEAYLTINVSDSYGSNKSRFMFFVPRDPLCLECIGGPVVDGEDPLSVCLRQFDVLVWSSLGLSTEKHRIRANELLRMFTTRIDTIGDYQGKHGRKRLYVMKLYQNDVIDYDRDELFALLSQCDRKLQSSKTSTYIMIAHVTLETVTQAVCGASMFTVELENVLSGGQLFKAVQPILQVNKVSMCVPLDEVTSLPLRDVTYFVVRAVLVKMGYQI